MDNFCDNKVSPEDRFYCIMVNLNISYCEISNGSLRHLTTATDVELFNVRTVISDGDDAFIGDVM